MHHGCCLWMKIKSVRVSARTDAIGEDVTLGETGVRKLGVHRRTRKMEIRSRQHWGVCVGVEQGAASRG